MRVKKPEILLYLFVALVFGCKPATEIKRNSSTQDSNLQEDTNKKDADPNADAQEADQGDIESNNQLVAIGTDQERETFPCLESNISNDCDPNSKFIVKVKVFQELQSGYEDLSLKARIPINQKYLDEYDFFVDWGDGNTSRIQKPTSVLDNSLIHTYNTANIYEIKIYGSFPSIKYGLDSTLRSDRENHIVDDTLIEIVSWGNIHWRDLDQAFQFTQNLDGEEADDIPTRLNPNLDNVSSLDKTFAFSSFNSPVDEWNIQSVTNLNEMFHGASNFNQNMTGWNTSNVQSFKGMFARASLFNGDISTWNMIAATDISFMFFDATQFNRRIGDWNITNVKNAAGLFEQASSFNMPIGSWNVESLENAEAMFALAENFRQDLSGWNTSSIVNMESMFFGVNVPTDLSGWNIQSVTNSQNFCPRSGASVANMPPFLPVPSASAHPQGEFFRSGSTRL